MVKIISDSTCDLSKELLERYDVAILPLHVLLGEEDYRDGVTIVPDEVFQWANENKATPKTAAPTITEVMDLYRPYLDEGMEIVSFSIASGMSGCNNIMRLAAEELDASDRVQVIDSANLSTGIGLQVIEAAIMAADGHTAAEIAAHIEEIKPLVRASFVVDTLVYLYRGGRCGGLSALLGSALKLHPKIVVQHGEMSAAKKYRGSLKKAILDYTQDLLPQLKNAYTDRVFITHSGCDREIVEAVRAYLEDLHIFSEVIETRAGCCVSSHCGPGTLGVLFIERS